MYLLSQSSKCRTQRYQAVRCETRNGKQEQRSLGRFHTGEEAALAYQRSFL